ncbi:methyltransferase family protein [Parapedobacter sp. GCM10030251]|jgi:Putative protein-S-isoprenylcysteine methyltransferase|uniref:methyltransferase family protein n=1 Tax=Parapedobacter sp. GCM10030251 TaxID=3273419 RepID=UPI003624305F
MKSKLTPDIYFIGSIALSIFFDSIIPIWELIPDRYAWVGVLLIAAGALLVYATNFVLLKKKTSTRPFGRPTVLITTGPFKWSRNPIYMGMTVVLIGIATVLGSLSAFIFPIIFTVLVHRRVIPVEEYYLQKRFGEAYLTYKTRVKRWI